jgi:hypothetical protein
MTLSSPGLTTTLPETPPDSGEGPPAEADEPSLLTPQSRYLLRVPKTCVAADVTAVVILTRYDASASRRDFVARL